LGYIQNFLGANPIALHLGFKFCLLPSAFCLLPSAYGQYGNATIFHGKKSFFSQAILITGLILVKMLLIGAAVGCFVHLYSSQVFPPKRFKFLMQLLMISTS
jgi:hypothetical protein